MEQHHVRYLRALTRLVEAAQGHGDADLALSAAENALAIALRAHRRSPEDVPRRVAAEEALGRLVEVAPRHAPGWVADAIARAEAVLAR